MTDSRTLSAATERISLAIVEAIADAEGVDPAALDPPLGAVVDPIAIDRLFGDSTVVERLTFSYRGYRVTVDADGEVRVE
ncbi:HalOD1 output domain-containing protein [Salinilacihabitans rarus]|uniref:HalOD1 output domain-containing protein n=1 Tax=Salinilacihabitans rarus TaxID=2961596 RepID=UPI0020C9026C|nr:HalOD1 output domain-containing protein [Salinilacihabitans rarus]